MTFATNAMPSRLFRRCLPSRGFTLLELLLVVGIIALLAGILLPAVSRAYGKAIQVRTQADLQAISTALEAYKSDFGSYPIVTSQNSGAATLCKALIGPGEEAKYYTRNPVTGVLTGQPSMTNTAPDPFSASKTYQAGDIVSIGGLPSFDQFVTGTQNTIYVSVRNENMGHTPDGTVNDLSWAKFLPYDGNDGAGVKARLASAPDAAGLPHGAAGKVYGPYLDVDHFKINGVAILDRYNAPILYFPVNASLRTNATSGKGPAATMVYDVSGGSYPGDPPAAINPTVINARDNFGAFFNESATPPDDGNAVLAKIRIMLGSYDADPVNQPTNMVPEPPLPALPYLLWTAGPDGHFGPSGQQVTGSFKKGDYHPDATNPAENQITAQANDDVTNFKQ